MRERDATGKTPEERFAAIRREFLALLAATGIRRELYRRPKPGDAREPTEEEIMRRWADALEVSVNDIVIGVQRAFQHAGSRGQVVASFRYCVPWIQARIQELREARAGLAPAGEVRVKPQALERARRRMDSGE